MTNWLDEPVKATPHRSLNSSKGIIRCRDLRDCSDEEVLEAFRPQGVIFIKHIMAKKEGASLPTNTFILTFSKPIPPKSVKAAYLSLPVEPFIPNPLRCFNCQKFGHGKNTCSHKTVCARCSKPDHAEADCTAEPICANCAGPHPAFSKDCPEWIKQRAILRIKTDRNISFNEARQVYEKSSHVHTSTTVQRPGATYASVSKNTTTIATQTDLTWPNDRKEPINTTVSTLHQDVQTNTDKMHTEGAVGGKPANTPRNNPAQQKTATPRQKLGKKTSKGSDDPIQIFNRFGSLDDMDLEVDRSPKRGQGGRRNQ